MKLPRKIKKKYLGYKISGNKLRMLLRSVVIVPANNGHDSSNILPYPFCPKCGCASVTWGPQKAAYPERWHSGFCSRCGYHVWESDNSPYYHALEMEDYLLPH